VLLPEPPRLLPSGGGIFFRETEGACSFFLERDGGRRPVDCTRDKDGNSGPNGNNAQMEEACSDRMRGNKKNLV
jgi:hypothetical protein